MGWRNSCHAPQTTVQTAKCPMHEHPQQRPHSLQCTRSRCKGGNITHMCWPITAHRCRAQPSASAATPMVAARSECGSSRVSRFPLLSQSGSPATRSCLRWGLMWLDGAAVARCGCGSHQALRSVPLTTAGCQASWPCHPSRSRSVGLRQAGARCVF